MKNSVIKRVWAWIMVACMLFTMAPAFAEEAAADVTPAPVEETAAPSVEPATEEVPAEPVEAEEVPAEPAPAEPAPIEEPEIVDDLQTNEGLEEVAYKQTTVPKATATIDPDHPEECPAGGKHEWDASLGYNIDCSYYQEGDCSANQPATFEGYCKKCHNKYPVQAVLHLNVSYKTDADHGKAPTCTRAGEEFQYCEKCHTWGSYYDEKVVLDPSLGDYKRTVPALGHDLKAVIGKKPTCTEPGVVAEFRCQRAGCGHWYNINDTHLADVGLSKDKFTIAPTGHTPGEPVHEDADCIHNERNVVYCTVCKAEISSTDVPGGTKANGKHVYGAWTPAADNRTEPVEVTGKPGDYTAPVKKFNNNKHERTCLYCGEKYEGVAGDMELVYPCKEWQLVEEVRGDCNNDWSKTWQCAWCGQKVSIHGKNGTGHIFDKGQFVTTDFKTATCANADKHEYGYKVCDVCNKAINRAGTAVTSSSSAADKALTVLITGGHDWKETGVATPATCDKDGSHQVECQICHTKELVVDPKTGHKYEWVIEKGKTCVDNAKGLMQCSVCKAKLYEWEIPNTKGEHVIDQASPDAKVVREASCDLGGVIEVPCSICDTIVTVPIPKLGHNYVLVTSLDRCDKIMTGTLQQCTRCGDVIAADGYTGTLNDSGIHHDFDGDGKPDCPTDNNGMNGTGPYSKSGWKPYGAESHIRTCSLCGYTQTQMCEPYVDKAEAKKIKIVGNCMSVGKVYYQCTRCEQQVFGYDMIAGDPGAPKNPNNHVGAQDDAVKGRDYTLKDHPLWPATCTKDGYAIRVCACGAELTDFVEPVAAHHTWKIKNTITPATCEAEGLADMECSVCGATEKRVLPKTGHSYTLKTMAPTCEHGTLTGSFCEWCKQANPLVTVFEDKTDKLEHDWGDLDDEKNGKVIDEGDCVNPKIVEYTCKTCKKATMVKKIPGPGKHSTTLVDKYTKATCTKPAYVDHCCSVCGKALSREPVLNSEPLGKNTSDSSGITDFKLKAAHDAGDATIVYNHVAPAGGAGTWLTSQAGKAKYVDDTYCALTCPTCGETILRTHKWITSTFKGDCLYPAMGITKCEYCNTIGKDTPLKPYDDPKPVQGTVGHHTTGTEADYYFKLINGDCEKGGWARKVCSYCDGNMELVQLKPGSHQLGKTTVVKPTCVKDGSETGVCKVCGKTVMNVIPKLSADGTHTWGEWVTVTPATETAEGLEQRECEVCGEIETQKIPVGGKTPEHKHTWVADQMDKSGQAFVTYCPECGAIKDIEFLPTIPEDEWDCTTVYMTSYDGTKTVYGQHFGYNADGEPDGSKTGETKPASAATCTKPGSVAGTQCLVCLKVVGAGTAPKALGHTWEREGFKAPANMNENDTATGWVVDKKAEAGKAGEGHYVCTDPKCDDPQHNTRKETIPALPGPAAITVEVVKMGVLCAAADDASAFVELAKPGQTYNTTTETFNGYYKVNSSKGTPCYIHADYCKVVG